MWRHVTVQWKLAQPLAVGPGWNLGFVNLTRLYVPPRTLWGAFTDALGRCLLASGCRPGCLDNAPENSPFAAMGGWVERNIRFLPGRFLSRQGQKEERIEPWYKFGQGMAVCVWSEAPDNQAVSEIQSTDAVRARYVSGRGQTALNYDTSAAAEGMLHETERIMPKILCPSSGLVHDVWLETRMFVLDEENHLNYLLAWIKSHGLDYLRVGRDAAAGDGCFEQVSISQAPPEDIPADDDGTLLTWNLDSRPGPCLVATAPAGGEPILDLRLPGPLLLSKEDEAHITGYWGDCRPYMVREYGTQKQQTGFGRNIGSLGEKQKWVLEWGGVVSIKKDCLQSTAWLLGKEGFSMVRRSP